MTCTRCHRCDRSLIGDDERWLVCVNVTADFEQDLADSPAMSQDPALAIPRLIAAFEGADAADLEDEAHSELAFLLCARCRTQWLDNPLGLAGRPRSQANYLLH